MKKLILLLFTLSIYQIGFSQVDLNIDKKLTIEEEVDENYTPFDYISNGVYEIVETGYGEFSAGNQVKKDRTKMLQVLKEFVERNDYTYEVISDVTRRVRADTAIWTFRFRLKDSSGNLIITKKEARKKLLDLKELLDLGLISQTEFDNKAQALKQILLN